MPTYGRWDLIWRLKGCAGISGLVSYKINTQVPLLNVICK